MFKFGFSKDDNEEEHSQHTKSTLDWIPAAKVDVSSLQCDKKYECEDYMVSRAFPDLEIKLIRVGKALADLKEDKCENILISELQHSDLIPAKYEGGLKIWECSYDIGKYIMEANLVFENKLTLDVGCGAGIIGLLALLKGSVVHFQDYNVEVLRSMTIPNVLLNFNNSNAALRNCEFYSGDWSSFVTLPTGPLESKSQKYDYIFTSETIYNPENHRKLYEVFKRRLKQTGTGYIAAKTHYFGVGGSMRQFENVVREDGCFNTEVIWKSHEGLQREILRISWNTSE